MATPATGQTTTVKAAAGGGFLLEERTPQEVFTPEDFNDEQRQIAETASNFARKEILPAADAIEAKDYTVMRALLAKAGELGLMATDTPEEYGGLAMDKVASAIVGEQLSVLEASPPALAPTSASVCCPSSGTGRRSRRRSICRNW